MNIIELCKDQVEMVKVFCRAKDFESAKNTMDNFRNMGLDESHQAVQASLSTFKKFEAHIETLQK